MFKIDARSSRVRRITVLVLALLSLTAPQAFAAKPPTDTAPVLVTVEGGTNFGAYPVGSTTTRTVTVTNISNDTVYIGTVSVTSNNGAFGLDFGSNTCLADPYLAPGESCSYAVLFTPTKKGNNTGYTTVGANNQSVIVDLRGRGT